MKRTTQQLITDRARLMGPQVSTFYEDPLNIVKGDGVWLWDADGRKYLDCYNNVPHVGHCNPRVVDAICRQASTLNTHTRYLHDGILDYIERLTATMADPLDARQRRSQASAASSRPTQLIMATPPSSVSYRSPTVLPQVSDWTNISASFKPPTAIARPIQTGRCLQQRSQPKSTHSDGWLKPVAEVVKRAGGVLICDEVQSGFGRTGTHMWAHDKMGVVPDIVVLGKPMANGHPVGGVVANRDVIAAFRNGYRYFNTFGGNPVSCAAAMAVLEEIEDQNLVENADTVGTYARTRLAALAAKHATIGDVRGAGLIFGAEMVTDRETKNPASDLTDRIINDMRHSGVILSKLGRHKNALKIRPPMPFSHDNVDLLCDTLDDVLAAIG